MLSAQIAIPCRLQAQLLARGVRMTQQRRAILSVMETASKHLDAAQVLRKARKLSATLDRSTVYRTLDLLKRHGLMDGHDSMPWKGEGHDYKHKLDGDHIQMICLHCGQITELVDGIFNPLKQQLERECRFSIVSARLEIDGYCCTCRR